MTKGVDELQVAFYGISELSAGCVWSFSWPGHATRGRAANAWLQLFTVRRGEGAAKPSFFLNTVDRDAAC